jgi:hypothetical protein
LPANFNFGRKYEVAIQTPRHFGASRNPGRTKQSRRGRNFIFKNDISKMKTERRQYLRQTEDVLLASRAALTYFFAVWNARIRRLSPDTASAALIFFNFYGVGIGIAFLGSIR